MERPYVVSADVRLLLQNWADQRGFKIPSTVFFDCMREKFSLRMQKIFPNFELVPEKEIVDGLFKIVSESGLPPVSLDGVYFKSEMSFEITRLVNRQGQNIGWGNRAGTLTIPQQLDLLRKTGVKKVALVDDVIFSGNMLEMILNLFSSIGICVPVVCAGIGIAHGIKHISYARREIYCVRTFDQVIDEICERDFYPGVPLSGRLLSDGENIGVPYIYPFGKFEDWASIPSEYGPDLSDFCLQQTTLLFEEIERISEKKVFCQDLGRKVISLPTDNVRYVDALCEARSRLVL